MFGPAGDSWAVLPYPTASSPAEPSTLSWEIKVYIRHEACLYGNSIKRSQDWFSGAHCWQHTLPPKAPLTSLGRPALQLSQVQFLGAPHEMLYKSPLIFRKVKCYYVFNEEVTPTCMEPTCLWMTLPSGTSKGSPPCLFLHVKF